jgi:hypothetical protein
MIASWIVETRQAWKLVVFYALILVSLISTAAFVAALNDRPILPWLGFGAGVVCSVVAAFSALAWICVALRCAVCGCRPAWWAIRNEEASIWLVWLHSLDSCPCCHARG